MREDSEKDIKILKEVRLEPTSKYMKFELNFEVDSVTKQVQ